MPLGLGSDIAPRIQRDFGLVLQRRQDFDGLHAVAEPSSAIFVRIHAAIGHLITVLEDPVLQKAFLDGVQLYEIVATLEDPNDRVTFNNPVGDFCAKLEADRLLEMPIVEILTEANDELSLMHGETPKLLEIGREVLYPYAHYDDHALGYAMSGLALTRHSHKYTTELVLTL